MCIQSIPDEGTNAIDCMRALIPMLRGDRAQEYDPKRPALRVGPCMSVSSGIDVRASGGQLSP